MIYLRLSEIIKWLISIKDLSRSSKLWAEMKQVSWRHYIFETEKLQNCTEFSVKRDTPFNLLCITKYSESF